MKGSIDDRSLSRPYHFGYSIDICLTQPLDAFEMCEQ